MNEEKYEEVIPFCNKELSNEQSCKCNEARLLRGTFYFLSGELDKTIGDIDPLIEDTVDKKVGNGTL